MSGSRRRADKVTIQAVAAHAGVSVMTVSNVANNLPNVRSATRERVLASIEELGYVPSMAARSLKRAIASRVGLVYFDHDFVLMDATLAAISIAAADRGLQLLLRKLEHMSPSKINAGHLPGLIDPLLRSGAEALILLSPVPELLSTSPLLKTVGVPLLALETASPLPGISTFRINNRAAMQEMTELVISHGYRRLAIVTGARGNTLSEDRYAGYHDALVAAGMEIDPSLAIAGDFSFRSGLSAAEQLLQRADRPDAILTSSDDMAAAVMLVAHQLGIRMPEDLAVTGFDDSVIATRVWPNLTSVRLPLMAMAERALDHLAAIVRRKRPTVEDFVFEHVIVERDSSRRTAERS